MPSRKVRGDGEDDRGVFVYDGSHCLVVTGDDRRRDRAMLAKHLQQSGLRGLLELSHPIEM